MKTGKTAFVIILAGVVILGLAFSLYAFSKIRAIRHLRSTLQTMSEQAAMVAQKAAVSPEDEEKAIPEKLWATEFMETVYSTANKYDIKDLAFEQKAGSDQVRAHRPAMNKAKAQKAIKAHPVKISFRSGYRAVAEFVREIQSLDKPITIESLKIKRNKGELSVEMTANTYSMEGL